MIFRQREADFSMNMMSSNSTPDVIQLIQQRTHQRSTPQNRTEKFKLGLAIEGGGMRGVVCGGMVAALEELGLRGVFDGVYGSSAGAISGAYFVAGQARYGATIFYEDINNHKFINELRILLNQPVLSLAYLLDHVCENVKPLNWNAVISSDVPLTAVATSISDASARYLASFSGKAQLKEALRASATVPIAAGPPTPFADERYLDAMLFEPMPYRAALANGCTHILVLSSLPDGYKTEPRTAIDNPITGWLLSRYNPALGSQFARRLRDYESDRTALLENMATRSLGVATALIMISKGNLAIRSTERRTSLLERGAAAGMAAIFSALQPEIDMKHMIGRDERAQ